MKLKEIAAKIGAHLKRFEADPKINRRDATYGTTPYYNAGAFYSRGAFISVRYVSYQHTSHLRKNDALAYLEWLDAGNVGRHHQALRK